MPLLALSLPTFHNALLVTALVLGFGFVIFFHELGHFLAAKWVGIKVEQFAVGFGQALLCYRKGIGLRVGSTQREYRRRLEAFLEQKYKDDPQVMERSGLAYQQAMFEVEKESGLGETEYRLNWIPLGGYVKMLGQDDLRPNAEAEDPRSYNKRSIGARMVVVSAGVVMNVILAGVGFTALFMYGFNVPPAWVGSVASNSPATKTVKLVNGQRVRQSLRAGDQILEYQGKAQDDFTKIGLYVPLSAQDQEQTIKVRHPDGTEEELLITPQPDPTNNGFLSIGIRQPQMLRGPDARDFDPDEWKKLEELEPADMQAVKPGETVTQINGQDVDFQKDFWKLPAALQNPDGKPVDLTVKDDAGHVRHTTVRPHLGMVFGGGQLYMAGMTPRPQIPGVQPESAARGKILPGDIVLSISTGSDNPPIVDTDQFRKQLLEAGNDGKAVSITVLRDGKQVTIPDLAASTRIDNGKGQKARGLGVQLGYDEMHPVVAGIEKDSPAYNADIPAGATITAINGHRISNWFDIQRELSMAKPGIPVAVDFTTARGAAHKDLQLNEDQVAQVQGIRRAADYLLLREFMIDRKARNPIQAISWGVTETRDFILQFYLTLRRMAGGSVSPDQLMGPVGIFVNGARVASKGWGWLVWFLSMISANLAVVNFLPIPIVDGGLFTFLLLEKIQGRPLSARTQAIAQYVGLAFLAGVFLFVTYHDILRFI